MLRITVEGKSFNHGVWQSEIEQYIQKNFEVSETKLQYIANLIRSDIEDNIRRSLDYQKSSLKSNSPSTIKIKGFNRPLYNTGELASSVISQKVDNSTFNIFISENRSSIASYLHFGTNKIPPRPFFGISPQADSQIDKELLKD